MTRGAAGTALDRFLWSCSDEIDRRVSLATKNRAVLEDGARSFRAALGTAANLDRESTTVPAASFMHQLRRSALADAALAANDEIPWVRSPRVDDGGSAIALALLDQVRDMGPVSCGMMLLAPGAEYPEHSHPPHEIYLPVAGEDSDWRHGGHDDYRRLAADELVYNHPNGRHGTIAGAEPVLALYVLW